MGSFLLIEPIEAIVILGGVTLIGFVLWYFFGKPKPHKK